MTDNLYIIDNDSIKIYATRNVGQYIVGRAENLTKNVSGYVACYGDTRTFAKTIEQALRSLRFILDNSSEKEVVDRIKLSGKVTRKDLYLLTDMCDSGITKTMIEFNRPHDMKEIDVNECLELADGRHDLSYLKAVLLGDLDERGQP